MAWCPKCKCEYEDHVSVCAECSIDLTNHLENIKMEYNDIKFLSNVRTLNDANILISLLSSYGIPAYYKNKASGEYLQIATGMNFHGVDVYVPSQFFNNAKDIIEDTSKGIISEENNYDEDTELHELNLNFMKRKRYIIYSLIIITIGFPVCVVILNLLFRYLF